MADLGMSFDPAEVPENERNFDPIPDGDYLCQVIDSDVVENNKQTGMLLKLTLEVMSGPFANRKIFIQLNIQHQSAEAQKIGQRELADLCLATGVGSIRDSEELHFRPFVGRVGTERDKEGKFDPKNKIKRYKPAQAAPPNGKAAPVHPTSTAPSAERQAPQTTAARSVAPAQPASSNGPTRPWKRQGASAA